MDNTSDIIYPYPDTTPNTANASQVQMLSRSHYDGKKPTSMSFPQHESWHGFRSRESCVSFVKTIFKVPDLRRQGLKTWEMLCHLHLHPRPYLLHREESLSIWPLHEPKARWQPFDPPLHRTGSNGVCRLMMSSTRDALVLNRNDDRKKHWKYKLCTETDLLSRENRSL